ncbi:MAG: zf-HC2 domain-containing protein [Candidatus Omnitrophica bacterium]|nr:zf-HC2 domain-containing protein [Candidatus Omnitrophota bacterium]
MNCKEIQELILTDYLDGEIHQGKKGLLESHLASCRDCKEFFVLAQQTTVEPFMKAKKYDRSRAVVWARLQEDIQNEKKDTPECQQEFGLIERWKKIIFFPEPVFVWGVFAVLVVLFFLLSASVKQPYLVNQNQGQDQNQIKQEVLVASKETADQDEYLAYYFNEEDTTDYGTSVEQYFL